MAKGPFHVKFETWGKPGDRPVLFFHGFPGARLQAGTFEPFLEKHGLFMIAADRPGYGGTMGEGSPADYLDAVAEVLNGLKIERFHILAFSGGSPWGHLMASRYSDRVDSLTVVAGLIPYTPDTRGFFSTSQRLGLGLSLKVPASMAIWIADQTFIRFPAETALRSFVRTLGPADQNTVNDPLRRTQMLASMVEARRQGSRGMMNDAKVFGRDWLQENCDAERLRSIPTAYHHGTDDRLLPGAFSKWMGEQQPHALTKFYKDEGHYSLSFNKADEILGEISRR